MEGKGFLIYAEGEDFVKQAYLSALSIKAAENEFPVSLVTNCKVDDRFKWVFDKIIDIPWYETSRYSLAVENRWKLFHATPYYETIVLDADTLVLENLAYAWRLFENYDLFFPTTVFTYRKEKIQSDFYRKAFTANQLPNFYNCVHYFKKEKLTQEFWEWCETVTHNWELFYGHFCSEYYPKEPSMDVTTAIVSKILDCDTVVSNKNQSVVEIVHMKPQIQNWLYTTSSWQDRVGAYLSPDLQLKIGNHRQDSIFHYTEKDFCTWDKIEKYEKRIK
jgi:hypothetical protein